MSRKVFIILLLIIGITGCYNDKGELLYPRANDCSSHSASFGAEVQPIIQSNCATSGCHDAASVNKGGPLTNYTLIKNKASVIRSQVTRKVMPQGSSLSASQIQLINCWVSNGALNN